MGRIKVKHANLEPRIDPATGIERRPAHITEMVDAWDNRCQEISCRRWFRADRNNAKYCPGGRCRQRAFAKRRDDELAALRKKANT